MKCGSELAGKFIFSETSAGADRDRHMEGLNPSSLKDAWLGRSLSVGKDFSGELRVCNRERAFSLLARLIHTHVAPAVSFCSAWESWHAAVSWNPDSASFTSPEAAAR